jgi:hypothetical protein
MKTDSDEHRNRENGSCVVTRVGLGFIFLCRRYVIHGKKTMD